MKRVDSLKVFSKNVKIEMKKQNLTKWGLSRKIDTSYVTLDNVLSGKNSPVLKTLDKISEALGVTTDYLLTPKNK